MLLMIDNYDSFTYNLVHYCQHLSQDVIVKYNNEISIEQIKTLAPDHIIISPGPCTPNEAGISMEVINTFIKDIPILGVCLGHQSLAQVFGGKITKAPTIMHGKTSQIYHNNTSVFTGLPDPFVATRYHSLTVDWKTLPNCLDVTAWTCDQNGNKADIMGLQHKEYPCAGVQFHPESLLTECGYDLLQQFLGINVVNKYRQSNRGNLIA